MNGSIDDGWIEATFDPPHLTILGLPQAASAHRKLVSDGILIALTTKNEHGWTLVLSHIYAGIEAILPGRLPTIHELREARDRLIPRDFVHMVALIEPPTKALLARVNRTETAPPDTIAAPGLPTSVRCVQMHLDAVTDDVVFGTEPA